MTLGKITMWLLFFLLIVYALIPGLLIRIFGYRAFKRGTGNNELALTFDDGPDETYTAQLLDLLKEYDIKVTFFVVGKNAEKHAGLIRRMHEEGHLIGIHNYEHKSNWLMLPKQVRRQIEQSSKIIERITGERPIYYRPPWGIINLFDFLTIRKFRLILWSRIVGDWWKNSHKTKLKKRLLKRLRSGEVILLHDSGETFGAYQHAPGQMLLALEEFLQELIPKGYKFLRIDDMLWDRTDFTIQERNLYRTVQVFLWMKWESMFHFMFQVQCVDRDTQFLHLRIRKYDGKTIELPDGECIQPGDRVAELHLDNRMLYSMGRNARTSMHLAIGLIREMGQTMPKIADFILNDPDYSDVKGLYGVSMINRGPAQFGFTVLDLPKGIFAVLSKWYLRMLMSIVHPQGSHRLHRKSEMLVPKIIVMSRKELLRRYHPENSAKVPAVKQERITTEQGSTAALGK